MSAFYWYKTRTYKEGLRDFLTTHASSKEDALKTYDLIVSGKMADIEDEGGIVSDLMGWLVDMAF